MKKKMIEEYAIRLHLDYKKLIKTQRIYLCLGVIISIVLYFIKVDLILIAGIFFIFLFFSYNVTWSLKQKNKMFFLKSQQQFANFLSYSIILLHNGFNVYQTIGICKEYLDEDFANLLTKLLNEIDEDKSLQPFSHFAQQFDSMMIMQLCLLLYQLQTNGYDAGYLLKFPPLLEKIRANNIEYQIRKRKESFSMYTIIPIIALVMIVFTMIFNILGIIMGGNYV